MTKTKQTTNTGKKAERASIDRYCDEIKAFDLLDREKEIAVARRVQKGDEAAKEEMITANLRLVVKIANEYARFGMPLEDLVAEGNIGLMTAVERFDPDRGAKFSTYGAFWIKQKIRLALGSQRRVIRLPLHVSDKLRKLARDERELGDELGREPNDNELARHQGIDVRRITELRRATQPIQSLDSPLSPTDPNSATLAAVVPDPDADDAVGKMEERELKIQLREMLEDLTLREQQILIWRFGLDGEHPKTLEEVGVVYGVTRERIRQIQKEAVEKLSFAFKRAERPNVPASDRIAKFPQPEIPQPLHEALSA